MPNKVNAAELSTTLLGNFKKQAFYLYLIFYKTIN